MSKLKHTPGPWITDGSYIEDYDNNCPLRRRIAIIDDGAGIENPESNARLIAAAPDMLESLIKILNSFLEEYEMSSLKKDSLAMIVINSIEHATGLSIEEVLSE